jgi:hypothetical protein
VELPRRLGWLKSGRFLRLLSAVVALAILTGVLYNAVLVDRMAPTYTIQINSKAGSGLAMTGTTITIEFSEPVRPDTAENAFSITPAVDLSFYWQGQKKLIVTPKAKLALSTKYRVHVASGVQDLAGNAQGSTADADFTTVGRPAVVSVVPAIGAQSVPVDASIEITFDRPMEEQRVLASLTLQPDINYQASWTGSLLTLKPTKPMEYGTTYTVTISDSAVDTDGTKLAPFVTTFTTASVGLRSLSLVPAPNVYGVSIHSQIAIAFDGPIDPSSVAGAFTITPSVAGSTKAVSLPDDRGEVESTPAASADVGPNVLVFTPDGPLTPHTTYTVTLGRSVKRANGQVATGLTWAFTTGEAPRNALNQIAFISHRSGVDNVWLMNPDGTYPREVTSELVPVSGYDISGDGMTIAYGAGGVVKKLSLSADTVTTLTPGGDFEYAPTITPDGTGLIVGRRDAKGADLGYWRYPLVSGVDVKQIAPDGAPGLGSVAIGVEGLTGQKGRPQWASRAALTADGTTMLVVRGADNVAEIVDVTGTRAPVKLILQGNSSPVWVQSDAAFYLAATSDEGRTWYLWRVTPDGMTTNPRSATGDVGTTGMSGRSSLAWIMKAGDGADHLACADLAGGAPTLVTDDVAYSEASPSFSPDGSAVVFGRTGTSTPGRSAGIWKVNTDGTGLTRLSPDGSYPLWVP